MPKQFDLLIFDWDGTLADSTQAIVDALQSASRDIGLPVPDDTKSRSIIGLGLREALQELFPGADAETEIRLVERYRVHYFARDEEIVLFDGVEDAMQELADAGFMLAVATGKGRGGLNRAMAQTGLTEFFHASRCAGECHSKPHPQMLEEILDELGAMPEKAIMIGDTHFDLQMAQNARMAGLGVSYGAQPHENLLPHAPLACFDSFAKLHAWLRLNA
ncbi:MAG TPA: HAD-IA family hydrolase [Novimethylophilus sp.]|jgi:phosphoglycolate phosphatase|uniref:HAD-IA family hydrolase n=1 Tax=Novimethylophilus sp. TaxID=2137426 RepID=UPI002F42F7BE